MSRRSGFAGHLAFILLLQGSCAEIPTAPRPVMALHGSVATREDEPIAHAQVRFVRIGRTGEQEVRVFTRLDGTFVQNLFPGRYEIYVVPPYQAGVMMAHLEAFEFVDPSTRFDYRFGGLKIEGTVTGPAGVTVSNASVDFFGIATATNEYVDAEAKMEGSEFRAFLPPGSYWARVRTSEFDGLPRREFNSLDLSTDTTLTFPLTGRHIDGVVRDPDGLPMAGVELYFSSQVAFSGFVTRTDGTYDVYVPDGFYRQRGFPGPAHPHVMGRVLGYLNVTGDVSSDLGFSGTWWSGVVRDSVGGTAIPFAWVSVSCLTESGSLYVTCDAGGAFRVSVTKGAWHRLNVGAPNGPVTTLPAIPAGADSTLELTTGTLATP